MSTPGNILRYLRLRTGHHTVTVVVTDDLNLNRGDELQFKCGDKSGTTYLFEKKVSKLIYAPPEIHPHQVPGLEDFVNSDRCQVVVDYHFFAIETEGGEHNVG